MLLIKDESVSEGVVVVADDGVPRLMTSCFVGVRVWCMVEVGVVVNEVMGVLLLAWWLLW